ncbi:subtilisin-like protease Glyma18g48580 [Cicer arietinum]|uniref:subtilisin-like protease Glyma18g48580 n=1 Tax=Cicer arietinum TaxID=3827 RepID=UPI003CC6BAE1
MNNQVLITSPSLLDSKLATDSHYDFLGSFVGSTEKAKEAIFYSYNRYINGFAAILDDDEAANVAKHPNVVSIFLNKKYELHTTRSWEFLGLERNGGFPKDSLWHKSLGEDIIIGNLDTGVWPESQSFSDEGFGPIPKKWRGICQVAQNNKDKFHCNRSSCSL